MGEEETFATSISMTEISQQLFMKPIDGITNLKFIYVAELFILQRNIAVFTRRFRHDRYPPPFRQRPRRRAQLLDRALRRTRRLGACHPGLNVTIPDTVLSICIPVALVVRLALSLRPAKRVRKEA